MSDLSAEVAAVLHSAGDRVIQRVGDNEDGWLGIAMDQAVDLVRDYYDEEDTQLELTDALIQLEQTQLLLEPLGKVGVRAVLRAIWDGRADNGRAAFLYYLHEQATFEERRAAMAEGTQAAHRANVKRQLMWETVATVLEQIGGAAVRLLIPCLFAAV